MTGRRRHVDVRVLGVSRDGIGHGLVEDAAHERAIRRYLDTFQPELVTDLLDRLAALASPETQP